MRLLTVFFFIFFLQSGVISAQDKEVLPDKQQFNVNAEPIQFKPYYYTGIEVGTYFMTNLNGGYGIENYFSPRFSFKPAKSWRFDVNTTLGSVTFHNMTIWDYYHISRGLTGMNSYFGLNGQGTYQVNDKLYFGTMVFLDKSFNQMQINTGLENKTNHGGSLFVGYKFSDKFSMQAGFELRRYDDPWRMNQTGHNGVFMP